MRIAHVTATFYPHNTGTGNVALHNALELQMLGHEVHVFAPRVNGTAVNETFRGIHIHRLQPVLRYGNAFLLPALLTQLATFDLIHLHMPFYGAAELIYPLVKLSRIPLVITHHQDVKLAGIAGIVSRAHDRLIGMRIMRAADRVCFTSIDYGKSSKFAGLMTEQQIHVVELPNGVDIERFTPGSKPTWLLDKYDLYDKQVVLFVGVLDAAHYFKGVDILLQALEKLTSNIHHNQVNLVIVGKGSMTDDYRRICRELKIQDRVIFAGYVPDEELGDYYRLADTTVLPSTTQGEAFGLVLVESMASGTPVIASALPGVRSVVRHNVDGIHVSPGDVNDLEQALSIMLTDGAQRKSMGVAGRTRVEQKYAWSKIRYQLDEIYRQAVSGLGQPTIPLASS